MIKTTLRVFPLPAAHKPPHAVELGSDDCVINEVSVRVCVTRPTVAFAEAAVLQEVAGGDEELAVGAQVGE